MRGSAVASVRAHSERTSWDGAGQRRSERGPRRRAGSAALRASHFRRAGARRIRCGGAEGARGDDGCTGFGLRLAAREPLCSAARAQRATGPGRRAHAVFLGLAALATCRSRWCLVSPYFTGTFYWAGVLTHVSREANVAVPTCAPSFYARLCVARRCTQLARCAAWALLAAALISPFPLAAFSTRPALASTRSTRRSPPSCLPA